MNKNDFVKFVAAKAGVTAGEAAEVLKAFDEAIAEVIKSEDSVRLGFGTVCGFTKETAARTARNPRTGETIAVPAKVYKGYPKVKFSKMVKPDCE